MFDNENSLFHILCEITIQYHEKYHQITIKNQTISFKQSPQILSVDSPCRCRRRCSLCAQCVTCHLVAIRGDSPMRKELVFFWAFERRGLEHGVFMLKTRQKDKRSWSLLVLVRLCCVLVSWSCYDLILYGNGIVCALSGRWPLYMCVCVYIYIYI